MATEADGRRWEVTVHEDIAPLEDAWRSLEARGGATAFQCFDWLSAWYEVIGRHGAAEPVIVTARRAGSPDVEAILPLCRTKRRFHSEVTFADLAVADFIGPVFAPEAFRARGAMRNLMAAVAAALPDGDVIRLDKISGTIGDLPNPLLDLPDLVPFPVSLWGLPLSGPAAPQPPGANKRVLARTRKRTAELEQTCDRAFRWSEEPAELESMFDALVDLRVSRFATLGRPDIFTDPMWLDFYKTLLGRRSDALRVVVTSISADGNTVAAIFGVGYRRSFHYLAAGFDMERFAHYMPGLQLVLDMTRECPDRGFDYLDLTIGDERYKKDLGAERRPLYETRLPVTLKGRLICLAWRAKVALRAYPRLFAAIRRLVRPGIVHRPTPAASRQQPTRA